MLMFDMKEEIEVDPQFIAQLMEQLDVFISIKPKPKQPSKVGLASVPREASVPKEASAMPFSLIFSFTGN